MINKKEELINDNKGVKMVPKHMYKKLVFHSRISSNPFQNENLEIEFYQNYVKLVYSEGVPKLVKTKKIENELVNELIEKLEQLDIQSWDKKYVNSMVLDGETWEIMLTYSNSCQSKYIGQNSYPDNWSEFKKMIEWIKTIIVDK